MLIATTLFAGLTLIHVFEVMLVARFFLGIITCWENVLTTLLIRDFAPMQYRAIYRAFYFTARTNHEFFPNLFSIGGVLLCHRFQRKTLMFIGTAGTFVGMFTMAMTVYYQHYAGVLVGQCIFIIFDGLFLQPTCWSYPSELNTLKTLPYSNLISWSSGTIIGSLAVASDVKDKTNSNSNSQQLVTRKSSLNPDLMKF